VYVNQTSDTGEEVVRSAYGPNYARLVEIKKKYDPNNVLRLNQNIKPNSSLRRWKARRLPSFTLPCESRIVGHPEVGRMSEAG